MTAMADINKVQPLLEPLAFRIKYISQITPNGLNNSQIKFSPAFRDVIPTKS
jgi:hypothetical protein